MPTLTKPFSSGAIEGVARAIGDAVTNTTLDHLLAEARVPATDESTKWRRLHSSLLAEQARTGSPGCVVRLVKLAATPQRWADLREDFEALLQALNGVLIYDGLHVRPDGKLQLGKAASTHDEADQLSQRLVTEMRRRGGHEEVVKYCTAELVREDCFNAVFEAIKGLAQRLRTMTNVDEDGYKLVAVTLEGQAPLLRLNPLLTETQRNEQTGVANILKGIFSAFRNPPGHQPKVLWHITEADALDLLSTLSLIHRRLDNASPTLR